MNIQATYTHAHTPGKLTGGEGEWLRNDLFFYFSGRVGMDINYISVFAGSLESKKGLCRRKVLKQRLEHRRKEHLPGRVPSASAMYLHHPLTSFTMLLPTDTQR